MSGYLLRSCYYLASALYKLFSRGERASVAENPCRRERNTFPTPDLEKPNNEVLEREESESDGSWINVALCR